MDWDHDFDLTGKRVAVIGTGASALQIVPAIAPIVEHLDVYQRTPIWVSPKWDPEIPRWLHRLLSGLPILQRVASGFFGALIEFYVLRLNLRYSEHAALMDRFQQRLVRFLERCVPDDDVRTRLRPTYALGCKRPSFSNTYYSTFTRDNVDLVTDPIERFTVDGVRTADGAARPIDAVVLATGFLVAFDPEVYRRRPVRGRDGFDLAAHWERNRVSAYHGITVPKLPNHFLVVGPYSTVARSFHAQVEIAADHLIRVIREARRRCATSVEIRQEAHDREHRHLLNGLRGSLWHGGRCDGSRTYYVDPHGDVTYFRPQTTKAARRAARTFPLDDYRYDSLAPQSNEPSTIAPAVDDTEALGHS